MNMKKAAFAISILALLSLAGCGANEASSFSDTSSEVDVTSLPSTALPSESSSEVSSTPSSEPEPADDYGDPATWPGEKMAVKDLGDCIMDSYPYDEMYDWGQSIMFDEEDGIYKMWWCRQSGFDTIWYAESSDLKHWHNEEKIMFVEENSTWIKMHVGKPTVIKEDGRYTMYFEAPATLNGLKEFDNNVFMATSNDGKHFDIYDAGTGEPYPIIRMSEVDMAESWEQSQNPEGNGYGYYGIGQPSITKKGDTYYLYCTYSLFPGDQMFVFQSKDGFHFDEGTKVFVRAGCGVKYNLRTDKFMMAYEYSISGNSRVFYMDSNDGIHFTYADYTSATNNQNILSRGTGFTRGYSDFVCNANAQVDGYTNYVAYMEGRQADAGHDWRQYCATWDIHIAMFELPDVANRPMTLPNGRIYSSENVKPYADKHVPYQDRFLPIDLVSASPTIDGKKDECYQQGLHMEINRFAYERRAVPSALRADAYLLATAEALYLHVDVYDPTCDSDDAVMVLLDEKRFAESDEEILMAHGFRGESLFRDYGVEPVAGNSYAYWANGDSYSVEFRIPWRYRSSFSSHQSFGFDCFVADKVSNANYRSVLAWNDFRLTGDIHNAGEIYFR